LRTRFAGCFVSARCTGGALSSERIARFCAQWCVDRHTHTHLHTLTVGEQFIDEQHLLQFVGGNKRW
jgi:hypothetical protein